MAEDTHLNRRGFLSIVITAIGGLITAGLAIPAVAYIIGPALRSDKVGQWIRLGSTAKVELKTPTLFKANVERQTGWIVNEEELSVYVLTEDGRNYIAMSNVCTHLGCRVRWLSEQGQFFCPCHNGVYDKEGKVVSGPPPRPLDRFDLRVEGDQVEIFGG